MRQEKSRIIFLSLHQNNLDEKSESEIAYINSLILYFERVDPSRTRAHRSLKNFRVRFTSPPFAMRSESRRKFFSNSKSARFFLIVITTVFFLPAFRSFAVDDIPPPFGFRWNDTSAKVEKTLLGAKGKIVSKERKEKRDVWSVEGLVQPGLKRTLFTFKEGFLVEVELQYEYPDWGIERYNERMGEIRRYFDAKFGTGKLVSRSRDTDTDVIQTLVGYQWIVGATMLELFYFSAQRDPNLFRSITVTYKAI
jgi:hypothetical protein